MYNDVDNVGISKKPGMWNDAWKNLELKTEVWKGILILHNHYLFLQGCTESCKFMYIMASQMKRSCKMCFIRNCFLSPNVQI